MARSHLIRHCRKSPGDCGKCGVKIKKGEAYYYWEFRYGGKHIRCAKHPPRQSDLTSSDKLSRAYAASEAIEDAVSELNGAIPPVTAALISNDPVPEPVPGVERLFQAIEDLKGSLEEQASEAEDVASEYNDSADNIEQAFSSSSTADECREKAEALEGWAGSLQSVNYDEDAFWQPFLEFVTGGMEDKSLVGMPNVGEVITAITKATDREAKVEDWQEALNALRDLRRRLLTTEAFDEAVDKATDALDGFIGECESAAGELSL